VRVSGSESERGVVRWRGEGWRFVDCGAKNVPDRFKLCNLRTSRLLMLSFSLATFSLCFSIFSCI